MTARGNNNRRRRRTPLGGGPGADAPVGILPVPSLIDGRRYKILDSGGVTGSAWVERTGEKSGRMQVPLGEDPGERRIRLHEMAHVRWTPAKPTLPEGVTWQTINAVEDRRVHRRLSEVGFGDSLDAPIFGQPQWDEMQAAFAQQADESDTRTPLPDLEVARLVVASDGTAEGEGFRGMADSWGRGWIAPLVDEIMDRHKLRGRRPAWRRTLDVAVEIDALFAELDTLPTEWKEKLPEYTREGEGHWGRLDVVELPMPLRMPRGLSERVRRATDRGAVPRNWHRMHTDGMIFSRKVRRPSGGTVLIDQSGSMSLDMDEVVDLMSAFPGVLIATYAGRGDRGQLRVIARNGRRASDHDCHHPWNGNVVDGPALDWLNDQPGPRVWISDGCVTGCGDNPVDPSLLIDAACKVRDGKILRVDRLGEILPDGGREGGF